MEKTRIALQLLLPQIPDTRDACVQRIIDLLASKRGIDKVHLVETNDSAKADLCFHYDPSIVSINEVERLAKKAGAHITDRYDHLLIQVKGVQQPRHARLLETEMQQAKGVQHVSVAGTGFIQIEFDKKETSREAILEYIASKNLRISSVRDAETNEEVSKKKTSHQCDHSHGVFGQHTEMIFALVSGLLLTAAFLLAHFSSLSLSLIIAIYISSYLAGGFFTAKEAVEALTRGEFEIDFLMLVAAIGSAALGHWAEGALLLFLFSLGHSLEHFAMRKARNSISNLTDLAPKTALLKNGDSIQEVQITALQSNDIVVVRPHSKIAADGVVVKGAGTVNQSPITGESMPAEKMALSTNDDVRFEKLDDAFKVYAGSINGSELLEIRVARSAEDSTIARLVELVQEAQTQKSATQQFADKVEKYYVPAVLILVSLLLFAFLVLDETFGDSFYRAMAVLVAASPCALAISTPSAVLSGVARAARGGVLIKGGRPLEDLGSVSAIAFDKTGTLTEGKPKLTAIHPIGSMSEDRLLEIIIATEMLSDHPLALAAVAGAQKRLNKDLSAASEMEAIPGRGIRASYQGKLYFIGNLQLFRERKIALSENIQKMVTESEQAGNTTMLVEEEGQIVGILSLMDTPRKNARKAVTQLKRMGITKMVMLTGDNQNVADAVAQQTGLSEAHGHLLPAEKAERIEQLKAEGKKVAMIGDGVNDALAMAKSTVGIAMGAAGSAVALETADVALMADNLDRLPYAIGLSKKAHQIIRQNLVISLGMVAILVPLTLSGIAHIGPAIIGHEGSTLLVVFNALRLLFYKNPSGS